MNNAKKTVKDPKKTLPSVFDGHGLPWKPGPFPSHSDANRLWAVGTKPILLGCGRLCEAHTPGESIAFDPVRRAAEIYFDTVAAFPPCGTRREHL